MLWEGAGRARLSGAVLVGNIKKKKKKELEEIHPQSVIMFV